MILTEETGWLGGQLTAQAVPPDEHPWIEQNVGTTHITNGCFRLHPVEWNIGEAAGSLAAYCLECSCVPSRCMNSRGCWRSFSGG